MRWASLALAMAMAITAIFGILALIVNAPRPSVIKVDCSMASFHPDYTPAMRKACQERHKHRTP